LPASVKDFIPRFLLIKTAAEGMRWHKQRRAYPKCATSKEKVAAWSDQEKAGQHRSWRSELGNELY